MTDPSPSGPLRQVLFDLERPRRMMARLWGPRARWQVRLRWSVPPVLLVVVFLGPLAGLTVPALPVVVIAGVVLVYNVVLAVGFSRTRAGESPPDRDRAWTVLQVVLDYAVLLALIHWTGGPASPLVLLLPLHVVSAAILFRPSVAYEFALGASAGLVLLSFAEAAGWIAGHPLVVGGMTFSFEGRPLHLVIWLLACATSQVLLAALATRLMHRVRTGVANVAGMTERVASLNDRLNSLYSMVRTIGRERRLDPTLSIVASELAAVLDVAIVTVKLLDTEERILRYVASHGLPPDFASMHAIEVERSPFNRRVLAERRVLKARVGETEGFQLNPQLEGLGITWVLFAPLAIEDRVIGVLGAYRRDRSGFDDSDADFLRLAAELVAVAIEDARTDEALQDLVQERSRFTLQVAHNLRAPLGAAIGLLEAATGGYVGEIPDRAREHVERAERRLRDLDRMVGQLLQLARSGERAAPGETVMIDLAALAAEVDRTWGPRASTRSLGWRVDAARDIPAFRGDPDRLGQVIENLVSNALKYTPPGGRVDVRVRGNGAGGILLEVEDTGIGIPEDEQAHLFEEFFRASNARRLGAEGTGLGLPLVKRAVEGLGGRLRIDSRVGRGTRATVELPAAEA